MSIGRVDRPDGQVVFSQGPFHLFSWDILEEEFDAVIKAAVVDAVAFEITDSELV
jgi:hypothetical protein